MKRSLPQLALLRPVTVIMLTVSLITLGVIAYQRIPLEFIPRLDMPFIGCFIPYPGATPEQVENEIAIPAEGEFQTIAKVRRITTTSNSDGCFVRLLFDWDADMSIASSEVRDRMERLKLELPTGVDRIFLQKFDSNSLPVMVFTLFREGADDELTHLARTSLQPRIMRLDGVADVEIMGRPEKEVLIEFDQSALRARNLALYEVVAKLQQASFNTTAGNLHDGDTTFYVRVDGEFRTPGEIGQVVVGPNGLRLHEVAQVGFASRRQDQEFGVDGKGSVVVMVRKESEANTVDVCQAVQSELDAIAQDPLYAGMQTLMFFDQSQIILSALSGLIKAGQFGGVLAMIVLYLFLRRVRPTLIVTMAIPCSLVAGLVFMFFSGMTLNLVTMSSLIIAVGLLVDNSIVVIENIYRYNQLGYSPEESAVRGAGEVGLAITASTLTTTVVFIPMLYMESGRMAVYMRQFGAPVTVSLIASLVIALTVIPLFASRMRPVSEHPIQRALARPFQRGIGRLAAAPFVALARMHVLRHFMSAYIGLLGWAMRWRALAGLLIVAALVATAYPAKQLSQQEIPSADTRQVNIRIEFERNLDMDSAKRIFDEVSNRVESYRDDLDIKHLFTQYNAGGGSIQAYLQPIDEYGDGEVPPYSTQEVHDILWQKLPARIPGAELRFDVAEAGEGQSQTVSVRMRGDDMPTLRGYAEQFRLLMEQIPGVMEATTDAARAEDEIQLTVDSAMAQRAGVTPMVIARSVDFALRGVRLPYIKQGGREIPVWAQFQEEDRRTRENLDNVAVAGASGQLLPLNQLVSTDKGRSPTTITRIDRKNVVTISANTRAEDLQQLKTELQDLIARFDMPVGYSVDMGDELIELDENMLNFFRALLLAIILIYLVMGALFESFALPLSILTTVPLAGIGVVWAMYLTSTPLDMVAFIGMMLLAGIVVNNGIVIIDYINQLRNAGMPRYDAILQAGRDRFRPVMMTALTTILGCVPIAMGGELGNQVVFHGLGRALIGGLTVGTILTLFVVPLFYSIVDDMRVWSVGFVSNMASVGHGRAIEDPQSSGTSSS